MEERMKQDVRQGLGALVALGLLATPAVLTAAPQGTSEAVGHPAVTELRAQLGASMNNAGAQLSFDLSRHRPLSTSRHPLLSEAHVGVGGTAAFTPAHVRTGVWVEAA